MVDDPIDESASAAERPSKTQRKRASEQLQSLGQQLARLADDELARIDLPDDVREAIEFAHRVTSHEGRRRHMQYIGKLMRRLDADTVRAQIASATGKSRAAVSLMHRAESWRDRLLTDDEALTGFMAEHPAADGQWLRAAIRAARREREAGEPPKRARELYRWLHEQLAQSAAAVAPTPESLDE